MGELSIFRKKLLAHQLLFENVPLIYQLGVPKLSVEHGQLCASFFPHKVTAMENQWMWDDPAFELTCIYPSCKIVRFANRKYDDSCSEQEHARSFAVNICKSEQCMRQLEKLCSETMRAWTVNRRSEDVILFENERRHIAEQLGLGALWGE